MRRFVGIVGGVLNGPYVQKVEGRKDLWYWAANNKEAWRCFSLFAPFLGERRLARAREVFGSDVV